MKTWIWIWIRIQQLSLMRIHWPQTRPIRASTFLSLLNKSAHLTLSLPGAGAEWKAARAGRRERVQLRPSWRLRLRAAFPDPSQAQGDEEGGGAHLQLCLSQEGGAGPDKIKKIKCCTKRGYFNWLLRWVQIPTTSNLDLPHRRNKMLY